MLFNNTIDFIIISFINRIIVKGLCNDYYLTLLIILCDFDLFFLLNYEVSLEILNRFQICHTYFKCYFILNKNFVYNNKFKLNNNI